MLLPLPRRLCLLVRLSVYEQDYAESFKQFSQNLVGLYSTAMERAHKILGRLCTNWPNGSY